MALGEAAAARLSGLLIGSEIAGIETAARDGEALVRAGLLALAERVWPGVCGGG